MRTRFYNLPGLRFDAPWHLGRVLFVPAEEGRKLLRPYLESVPMHPSSKQAQSDAKQKLEAWGEDALVRVEAEGVNPPQALMDALALLRFAARSVIRLF